MVIHKLEECPRGKQDLQALVSKITLKVPRVKQLQLGLPLCSTCGYCYEITKFGQNELHCQHPRVRNNPADEDFGCRKHSDYEVNND